MNKNRAKIVLNNKQYNLKSKIENKKDKFKIKIKFLENIKDINFMFEGCQNLNTVKNFSNLNTKYLKKIY